jgi:hypothetical protein
MRPRACETALLERSSPAFKNRTAEILLTPAGLEGFFKEFSVPAPAMTLPPADEPVYGEVQRMLETAQRYGLEFVLP